MGGGGGGGGLVGILSHGLYVIAAVNGSHYFQEVNKLLTDLLSVLHYKKIVKH